MFSCIDLTASLTVHTFMVPENSSEEVCVRLLQAVIVAINVTLATMNNLAEGEFHLQL